MKRTKAPQVRALPFKQDITVNYGFYIRYCNRVAAGVCGTFDLERILVSLALGGHTADRCSADDLFPQRGLRAYASKDS